MASSVTRTVPDTTAGDGKRDSDPARARESRDAPVRHRWVACFEGTREGGSQLGSTPTILIFPRYQDAMRD